MQEPILVPGPQLAKTKTALREKRKRQPKHAWLKQGCLIYQGIFYIESPPTTWEQ